MNKKYEMTDEVNGNLRRIRALRDIIHFGVKAGDFGGYVESEDNLSQVGDAWVRDSARVFDNARVYGSALVSGNARIYGDAWIHDSAHVYGDTLVYDNAQVFGDAQVFDGARVYGYATVSSDAWVYLNAQVYDNAIVSGGAMVQGNSRVCEDALVHGDAKISGDAYIQSITDYSTFTNVGSESGTLTVFKDQKGNLWATRGCFLGTLDEFEAAVIKNNTAQIQKEYALLIAFARLRLGSKS